MTLTWSSRRAALLMLWMSSEDDSDLRMEVFLLFKNCLKINYYNISIEFQAMGGLCSNNAVVNIVDTGDKEIDTTVGIWPLLFNEYLRHRNIFQFISSTVSYLLFS